MVDKMTWDIPGFPAEEGERRHRRIRDAMAARGIDCIIVAGHQGNYGDKAGNLRYFTNYIPWFDDEYLVFPLEGDPLLMCWSPGHGEWASRVSWIRRIEAPGKANYPRAIAERLKALGLGKGRIGIGSLESMAAYVYAGLLEALPEAKLSNAGPLLTEIRAVKSPLEIQFMERSAECADAGFQAMLAATAVGVPEKKIWSECEYAMTMAGAQPPSFTLIVSCPTLEAKGNAIPNVGSSRTLQAGDIILNEVTPSYAGYWTQLCRPIVLGEPSDSFKRQFQVHTELYELACSEARPGRTIAEIGAKLAKLGASHGSAPAGTWALQHIGLEVTDALPMDAPLQ
ncbi:MAG: aminopeptidase P family protein, partial [Chloroflexota bacterium]|nr:aminopeptidase P family protein [Chloroflexota bacterium]